MFGGKHVVEVYSEHSKYTSNAFQKEVADKEHLSPWGIMMFIVWKKV